MDKAEAKSQSEVVSLQDVHSSATGRGVIMNGNRQSLSSSDVDTRSSSDKATRVAEEPIPELVENEPVRTNKQCFVMNCKCSAPPYLTPPIAFFTDGRPRKS